VKHEMFSSSEAEFHAQVTRAQHLHRLFFSTLKIKKFFAPMPHISKQRNAVLQTSRSEPHGTWRKSRQCLIQGKKKLIFMRKQAVE